MFKYVYYYTDDKILYKCNLICLYINLEELIEVHYLPYVFRDIYVNRYTIR